MSVSLSPAYLTRYGPWAVVTGASSGIGRAVAVALAAAGFKVMLVARSPSALEALARQLAAAHGTECRVVVADLGARAGVDAVVAAAASIDVGLVVASAGFGTSGPMLENELADELDLLAVNAGAVLALSWHFGRRLVQRGRGGLILFGSLLGFQGAPRAANYAASKAYVQSLAEGLHVELAPRGVDVLAAAPGPVRSGFGVRARMNMGATDTPERVARVTLAALGRGMTVTPGPLSKFLTGSLMAAPRTWRVRIMAKIMGGMTGG